MTIAEKVAKNNAIRLLTDVRDRLTYKEQIFLIHIAEKEGKPTRVEWHTLTLLTGRFPSLELLHTPLESYYTPSTYNPPVYTPKKVQQEVPRGKGRTLHGDRRW